MKPFLFIPLILIQVESTKEVINSFKGIKSTDISVKGIKLNDPVKKVLEVLGDPTGKSWENGIFVYKDFIIKLKNRKVREISLKPSFSEFLKGDVAKVFTDEIFTDKELREKLIGEEVKIEVELIEISKINLEKWKIIFRNGFRIEGSKRDGKFTFQFLTLFLPNDEKDN